jgi:hypothetical protein
MQQRGMGFDNTVQELARVGGVHATGSTTLPWVVTDAAGQPIAVIGGLLRDFVACGNSAASCRSYAYDLLRWWRFLATVGVGGPATAVEHDHHPTAVAGQGPQVGDQPAQLTGQRGRRFGQHNQQRSPAASATQVSRVAGAGNFNRSF